MEAMTAQQYQFYRTFSELSKEEKVAFIQSLTDEEALHLRYTWEAWARDKQLEPQGDEWAVWLILAGRGSGKTRTGAEWIRKQVESGRYKRIALVGRTSADVRDVMLYGESGLMTNSPPWFKPKHEGTRRRVIWPNGAIATTYSAEEPDSLRGPQHDCAWLDELCLISGTMIKTSKSDVPIECIKEGDLVYTRQGLKKVRKAWCSSESAEVYRLQANDGRTIIGTARHPIWIEGKGFTCLHEVKYGDIMLTWKEKKNQLSRASFGEGEDGGLMANTTAIEMVNYSIEPCIGHTTDLFQKVWMFTTGMKTKQTTILPILKRLQEQNILKGIDQEGGVRGVERNVKKLLYNNGKTVSPIRQSVKFVRRSLQQQERLLSFAQYGVKRLNSLGLQRFQHVASGVEETSLQKVPEYNIVVCPVASLPKMRRENMLKRKVLNHAQYVGRSSKLKAPLPYVVPGNVELSTKTETTWTGQLYVSTVENNLFHILRQNLDYSALRHVVTSTGIKINQSLKNRVRTAERKWSSNQLLEQQNVVQDPALIDFDPENSVYCLSVKKLPDKVAVFNLEVEDCHEYFANGILTHNCAWRTSDTYDQLMFGLRLGAHPRAIVTTTPRPTKEIKQLIKLRTTFVTRGNTYENRDNLASMFFDQIITRYEGSRIGRQELLAELLDDAEGALWKRDRMIEAYRVAKAPDLIRIVVGVDPAITSEEDSDETGIIVAGRGADGHLYILDDLSLRGTPQEWATQAVSAYYKYRADRIIGEGNQGGDMVENTVRMVDKYVAYKKVHSKRGKYARAEPIAALYEQGKGHHVGMFPELEDQQCSWEQGMSESPDRLDALVHAATELMLEGYMGGGGLLSMQHLGVSEDEEFNPFW